MTTNEQLETVVRLACLTEDRTDDEQKALIAVAWRVDVDHNALTATNRTRRRPNWRPLNLVGLVIGTRVLYDDDQHEVGPPKNWERRWATWEREGGFARAECEYAIPRIG